MDIRHAARLAIFGNFTLKKMFGVYPVYWRMPEDSAPQLLWSLDPREAARRWLTTDSQVSYAPHSIAQYSAMIGTAADWLHKERERHLVDARPADVEAFLKSLRGRGGQPASAGTVRRYIGTLTMLFNHLTQAGLMAASPIEAVQQRLKQGGTVRNAPRFLSVEQSQSYIQWVNQQPRPGWCDQRDAALRCIYLACGITVEESLRLTTSDLVTNGKHPMLHIRTPSPVSSRQLPLPGWSQPVLESWSQTRAQLHVGGNVLFVARKRSPTVEVDGGEPMPHAISTSELYEIIRPAMEAAGMAQDQLGPQTLRNTYAVRQIDQGIDNATLMKWLGLRTAFSIDAIKRQLDSGNGPVPV